MLIYENGLLLEEACMKNSEEYRISELKNMKQKTTVSWWATVVEWKGSTEIY